MAKRPPPLAELHELVGSVVDGRYRVESIIGAGGMGAIFKAHREGLNHAIALKVLHPAVTSDPLTVKRFEREALSASKLDHPNIVRVWDYGASEDGLSYLTMELVEGTQLTSFLGKRMPPARAAGLVSQVLEGLDHAHAHGIVHRDLKPDNVLVTKDAEGREQLKLVDFGIAKILDDQHTQERLTRTGFVFGTPHYMSPEQASGGDIDHRADLYAVGLILYEMLAGQRPFRALDPVSMMRKQVTAAHDPLPGDVPRSLSSIVDRLLEKIPKDRFQSAREVVDALEATRARLRGVRTAKLPVGPTPEGQPTVPRQQVTEGGTVVARATPGGTDRTPHAGRSHPSASASAQMQPGSKVPWIITGLAVLGGAIAFWLWISEREIPGLPTQEVADVNPPEIAPEPAPEPPPTPETEAAESTGSGGEAEPVLSRHVEFEITTNVDAEIVDADDGGVYGVTNRRPIQVERSDDPLRLVLRADGYEVHAMEVVRDRNKAIRVDLVKKAKRPKKSKHKGHEEAGKLHSPNLVDPFKRD